MNPPPVFNPMIPYTGYFEGGFPPGKMVRIQGTVPPAANRFAINLQCPGDDIALHFNPRFHENKVVRNSFQCRSWGPEETYGHMPLVRGQPFEILILCEQPHFKIAVNGQHYVDYPHRVPYQRICSLNVEGEVMISQISHEGGPGCAPPPYAPPGACPMPPYPPGPGVPYPPGPGMPYPPTGGVYPPQPGYIPGHGAPPPPPGYPGHHGGHGTVITHMSSKEAKKKNKMAKKALKYGLPIAGVGLGAYALSHAVGGHHHHHGFHHHSSSSSSSSSSSEEE